jgi:hypothetical protein
MSDYLDADSRHIKYQIEHVNCYPVLTPGACPSPFALIPSPFPLRLWFAFLPDISRVLLRSTAVMAENARKKSVLASIADIVERFERNRGEYLHVCYDNQPKLVAAPIPRSKKEGVCIFLLTEPEFRLYLYCVAVPTVIPSEAKNLSGRSRVTATQEEHSLRQQ